jgi:hypothetical protein
MARRSKLSRLFFRVLILAVIAGAAFMGMALFRAGPAPQINMEADLPGIGKRTPIRVMFNETKRGLSNLKVELIQGDRVELLEERSHEPLEPWEFWGERVKQEALHLVVGSESIKGLKEGEATIRATADHAGAWLRRPDPSSIASARHRSRMVWWPENGGSPVIRCPVTTSGSGSSCFPHRGTIPIPTRSNWSPPTTWTINRSCRSSIASTPVRSKPTRFV